MVRYLYDRPDLDLLGPEGTSWETENGKVAEAAEKSISKPHRLPVVRLLAVTMILTMIAMFGGTAARYLKDWSDSSLATPKSFYFTSQELDGALYHRPVGGNNRVEFSFTLQNYLVTGYPTKSKLTYTCRVTYELDGEVKEVTDVWWWREVGSDSIKGTGTLTEAFDGGEEKRTLNCSISADAFQAAKELTVTVEAGEPYTATLTARVALEEKNGGVKLMVTDPGGNSGAVTVTLYNTSSEDYTVTLKWPTNANLALAPLVPDKTRGVAVGEDGTISVPKGRAVSVVFLKRNITDRFSESDFPFTATPVSK